MRKRIIAVVFTGMLCLIGFIPVEPQAEVHIPPVIIVDMPEIASEEPKTPHTEPVSVPVIKSMGMFKLTAYCGCKKCCGKWADNRPNGVVYGASGEILQEGYSIAVDTDVIPYGTEVIINGNTYRADDCGGAIKGNRIDVYFSEHEDAVNFGVQKAEVYCEVEE